MIHNLHRIKKTLLKSCTILRRSTVLNSVKQINRFFFIMERNVFQTLNGILNIKWHLYHQMDKEQKEVLPLKMAASEAKFHLSISQFISVLIYFDKKNRKSKS